MFKLKNLIPFLLLSLLWSLVISCDDRSQGIKTKINGSFPKLAGKKITLSVYDSVGVSQIDTTRISESGNFSFSFRRKDAGFFLLKADNKNYITLILDQEEKIEVISSMADIRKQYEVKGSPDSERYRDFEMMLESNRRKVDSLSLTYNENLRSSTFRMVKPELDKRYQAVFTAQQEYSKAFIRNHCQSLAALLVVNRRFGERKILSEESDFQYFSMVDSCLGAKYPQNKQVVEFQKRLKVFKDNRKIQELTEQRLADGNKVPDITLQDPSGKQTSLYSLQGRPVILYFWASWDKNSRQANQDLKKLIQDKKSSQIAVYAVGLESYKELWTGAIENDRIGDWVNVTDYTNVKSAARTLFNVPDTFPWFLLLDKNMTIRLRGNNFEELSREIDLLTQ